MYERNPTLFCIKQTKRIIIKGIHSWKHLSFIFFFFFVGQTLIYTKKKHQNIFSLYFVKKKTLNIIIKEEYLIFFSFSTLNYLRLTHIKIRIKNL